MNLSGIIFYWEIPYPKSAFISYLKVHVIQVVTLQLLQIYIEIHEWVIRIG